MNNRNNIFCRKKSLLSHVIIGFLLFFVSVAACSQTTYPVQSYTQLIPPYTSNVPSFYSGTKEKLVCTLINTDMQHPSIQVYLRMKITSSIFSIETPPQVFTPPIELQAGVPVRLSLNDLAVYFKRENMRITGGQNEFFRTQQLPDNFYRFHFEVYETRTNRLLSNPKLGYAQAMIAAGEPPILNLPKMGEVITENNIPNIFFSWTPRHMNSLASAYGTEYEITLVEIPDKNAVPENAFLYSRRLYNETVRSTSFIHTTAQPQLIPGMRYGWRVRAKAKDGIEDVNVFHNEGFSPIFWFDYKADCKPVQMLGAVYENHRMVVTWVANEAIDYTVEYRKKGSYQWYTGTIVEGSCPIFNLKNGETYEYRVGSRCVINDNFVYSEIKACTIPAEEARTPQCGIMPNVNISDKTPLPVLVANLPVFAGDFPVVVTEVQGSNGRFSGKGYVGIPYLGKVRVAVVFNNILVNKSFQLLDGYFETIYDAKNNLVLDIDEVFTGGAGVGDIRSGEELAAYKVDYTIDPKFPAVPKNDTRTQDEIREGKPYILVKSENGFYEFILRDADGNQKEVKASELPATIEDKKGDIYQVSENGEVKPVSTKSDIKLNDTTKEKLRTDIAAISFEPLPATRYALDVYNDVYKESTSVFEKYQLKDEVSKIPASVKFIVPGASDELFVRVKTSNADFDFDKVRFVTGVGKEYKGTPKNDKSGWNLTVVSSEANDGQEIYVVQQTSDGSYATLAKLNVFSYTPKETTINLVAVNGYEISNVDEIVDKLNTIYNKIGLDIKVNIIRGFDYAPLANGEPFSVTGSGLFSQYTADMKALNTAFKGSTYYKEGTPYLFMVKNKAQGADKYVLGDMPRNKQFGYLFSGADYKTVAHEIGHGLFHLQHLDSYFDNTSHPHLKDNVMNYPAGDSFFKLQWDAIHSPGTVWGMFEKDEDGMIIQKAYYWTPSAEVIYLTTADKGATNTVYTQTGFPNGALYGFNYEGNTYEAHIEDGYFKGYAYTTSVDGKTKKYHYYEANNTESLLKKEGDIVDVISRVYIGNCTTVEYRNKISKNELKAWTRTAEGSKVQTNKYFTEGEKINTLRISDCGDENETGDNFFSPGSLGDVPYLKSIESSFEDLSDEINYAADKINELMNRNSSYVYNNGYYRVHVDDGISVDETFLKHFDDKAIYLSDYSKSKGRQVEIYVVFQKFEKTILANNWNGYAKKVYEKSNLNTKDAILITVPYFDSEFTSYKKDPWPYTERLGFAMPGMYNKAIVSTSDIKKRSREGKGKTYTNRLHTITYYNITLAQSFDFIGDVYTCTAKPVKIHYGFLFPNGSISVQPVETNSYISGTDFSKAIILLKNKGLDEIAKLPKPSEYTYTTHNTSAGAISQATTNPNYIKELLEYNRKYDEICSRATITDQSQWTQVENEILFKEKYMDGYAKKYVEEYAFKSSFGQYKLDVYNTLGINSKFEWNNDHTYNKDNLTILDPIIYGVVDATSFVAGFWGLDFIPEGVGLAYAVGRKQPFEITSYSAGIMLVGVSGGYIRILGKYGDDAVDYVRFGNKFYMKGAGGKLEEVLEDQITSRLLRDYLNVPNVSGSDINKLETLLKEGRIPEIHLNTLINDTDVAKKADLIRSLLKGENLASNTIAKNALKEGLEPTTYRSLIDDFGEESMDLLRFVDNGKVNDELIESWKALKEAGRTGLCKNIGAVEILAKANKNSILHNLGISISDLSKIEGFKTVSYQEIINKVDEFATRISQNELSLIDFNKVIGDLQKGGNFSDGAYWTVKYLSDNINEFTKKILKFEDVLKVGENIRRVDVVDLTKERKIFYEMKSVESVPPGHFSEQFMKDLMNNEVSDLSQIKWIFNGAKNPANFKQNMMNAIDNLSLTDDLARKIIQDAPDGIEINAALLQQVLKEDFDNLFKLIP